MSLGIHPHRPTPTMCNTLLGTGKLRNVRPFPSRKWHRCENPSYHHQLCLRDYGDRGGKIMLHGEQIEWTGRCRAGQSVLMVERWKTVLEVALWQLMHRNCCMSQLMSEECCIFQLINWKNRLFSSTVLSPGTGPMALLIKNKRSICQKKKKPWTSPYSCSTSLPIMPSCIGSNFFLVYRFYGTRTKLPSPPRYLGHAWKNFRLALAHFFPKGGKCQAGA